LDKDNSREIQFKEELVRKAKNGDTKAFSLLYAGVCKEMYKFALYMMKHTEDAEDAVSETVISAFENIAKLKNESSFKSWIFTILGNQCRKMLGKRQKRRIAYKHRGRTRPNACNYTSQSQS